MKVKRYKIVSTQEEFEHPVIKITSSHLMANYLRQIWHDDMSVIESFYAIYLDRANNIKGVALISTGGTNGTICDIKLIFKYAVDLLAEAIILSHNHPSGNNQPSEQDKQTTKKIQTVANCLGVSILDHIIMTEENYFSFADEWQM